LVSISESSESSSESDVGAGACSEIIDQSSFILIDLILLGGAGVDLAAGVPILTAGTGGTGELGISGELGLS